MIKTGVKPRFLVPSLLGERAKKRGHLIRANQSRLYHRVHVIGHIAIVLAKDKCQKVRLFRRFCERLFKQHKRTKFEESLNFEHIEFFCSVRIRGRNLYT